MDIVVNRAPYVVLGRLWHVGRLQLKVRGFSETSLVNTSEKVDVLLDLDEVTALREYLEQAEKALKKQCVDARHLTLRL